jgi:hypothetical protein
MLAALKEFARNFEEPLKQRKEWRKWERNGRPMPPPHLVKQGVLLEYAKRYSLRTLVETGTQYGAMVHAMKPHFDSIISIELSPELSRENKASV